MSHAAEVTAVIPNWNRRDLLTRLLDQLPSQSQRFAEVVVVDNGSTDGSSEAAGESGARVIRLERNFGFARAVNEGIRACRTEWIAVLNNDVELAEDWLSRLLMAIEPAHWFATGKVLDWADRRRIDSTFDLLARSGCAWRAGNGAQDSQLWNQRREIWSAPWTAVLFRTSLFDRLGHLDEDFESYLEDVDFGLRCFQTGHPGFYVPEAVAWHRGSATLGRWSAEATRLIARNQLLLIAKHYPNGWPMRYGWAILVGQSLWGLVALRHRCFRAFLKGKREGAELFGIKRAIASRRDITAALENSEKEIRELQANSASDLYWRLYFALT